jgi:UrcA family protein
MARFGAAAAFAISFGLLGFFQGGASAQAPEHNVAVDTVLVSYGDLDLASQAGVRALLARVRSAAALACGGRPDFRDAKRLARFQACAKKAMDNAETRIGAPALTDLYRQSADELASVK